MQSWLTEVKLDAFIKFAEKIIAPGIELSELLRKATGKLIFANFLLRDMLVSIC